MSANEIQNTILRMEQNLLTLWEELKKERKSAFNKSKEERFYNLHRSFQERKRQLLEQADFMDRSELTQV